MPKTPQAPPPPKRRKIEHKSFCYGDDDQSKIIVNYTEQMILLIEGDEDAGDSQYSYVPLDGPLQALFENTRYVNVGEEWFSVGKDRTTKGIDLETIDTDEIDLYVQTHKKHVALVTENVIVAGTLCYEFIPV